MTRTRLAALALVMLALPSLLPAQPEADRLRNAKSLYFDRKYAEARTAWQAILAGSRGAEADVAAYWVARCSENLGEDERSFKEYGEFLARRPADRALIEEARTARVGIAARLYRAGKRQYLPTIREALSDTSKTVRYYAALQLAGLGEGVGQPAVPVLRRILDQETDADLVDRAKLALLKLDPESLSRSLRAPEHERPASGRSASWLKVRIFAPGQSTAKVSVTVPLALAEMVFKSLPDDAIDELRKKGYDAERFWEQLRKLGPTEIVKIDGEHGERIHIWIE
ncbi:MAG TPA: hypothetical protein VGL15_04025 [Vicinamibacteria bacterium]